MLNSSKYKKYPDLIDLFSTEGYSSRFCREFADTFIENAKKVDDADIVNAMTFYCFSGDLSTAERYLEMVNVKKLNAEERFEFGCTALNIYGRSGDWRSGVEFRDENVSFLEKYARKQKDPEPLVKLYLALSLIDCAQQKYGRAYRLINTFKPRNRNDVLFLQVLITVIYICAKAGDESQLSDATCAAYRYLEKCNTFEYTWSRDYLIKKIEAARIGMF